MTTTAICMRYYNGKEYLGYYTLKTITEALEEVRVLNENKLERMFNGMKINWTEVKEFFVEETEMMDTRDSFGVR